MIISLKNDKFTAQIDTQGAQLISLKDSKGTEYIWQRKEPYWQKCAPILFPVVGRPLGGVITVDGKDYEMPLHGFVSVMDFEFLNQSDNKVEFIIKSSDATLKMYPYQFELVVSFMLDEQGIDTKIKVVNADNKEIVFGVGGHPGICWPLFDGDLPEEYSLEFDKEYDITVTRTFDHNILPDSTYKLNLDGNKLHIKRELFEPDAIIVENPPFDKVKFVNKDGKGIRFEFNNFTTFAVWTQSIPDESPFLCLEPWNSMGKRTGESSNLKEKKDIITLEIGKDFVCSYKICPL